MLTLFTTPDLLTVCVYAGAVVLVSLWLIVGRGGSKIVVRSGQG